MQGIILKGIGGFYYIDTEDGIIECKARGKFRHKSQTPTIGDKVIVEKVAIEEGILRGYLKEILPRKNKLIRPAISNIDLLVVVVSQAPPKTDTFLIDKVCAIACNQDIEVVIFINKTDIDEALELEKIYTGVGYKVIKGSAIDGSGIDELSETIRGKITTFTGNSAVGKSSILNQIDPQFDLKVGGLSEKIGRGKHTTRHVELLKTKDGSFVADTPGFSSFDTTQMDLVLKENLQHTFIEFEPYIGECKFSSCSHTKEKGCAILQALNEGKIAKSRFDNYVKLYDAVKDIKEWELK
ncbi:MAG: ribosome small subunit-dependent GTPase A [Clostridia bacterium]